MPARTEAEPDRLAESLRRRIEDYERWFRVLDAQVRVLERERQKLAAIVNHTDAGFIVIDPGLRIVWANDEFARRFAPAESPGDVLGRHCCELLCRKETLCEICPASQPFRTAAVAHHEIRLQLAGQTRHIYATFMPIASPEGAIEQAIVMLQDVSDLEVLRRSQEALQTSEERFRSIFEQAGTGMATVAPDGRFLQVNRALCDFLGYAGEELMRLNVVDVTHPEDLELTRNALRNADGGEARPIEFEKRYVRKDGATVWARLTSSLLRDAERRPLYYISLVQDITERKRLEEELRQAEKMSAVGQLVSGVAHELNNPLAGVLGYAQLLLKSVEDEKVRRGLETINREAERCKRIVHNLQIFARKHQPQEDYIGVNGLLESTLELRSYQLKVDDIGVVLDLDPDLPKTMGDFHQLRQVFLNVVINAHQAMAAIGRGGTLTLRTRQERGEIVVEIGDTGSGIPPENLGRIFDPFFTTKEVGQGTGLGLSICYGVVRQHGGRISARNAPEGGAVFTVWLPIRGPLAPEEIPAGDAAAAGSQGAARGNILVVDDEPSIIDILFEALRLDGHRVDTALNGAVALRKLSKERYDLIISDIKMPGMGGQEFYSRVQQIDPPLAARIVFSTGDVACQTTQTFLERCGNRYLQKPFEIDAVRNIVQAALLESGASRRG